jgi:hypothetical protein
MQDAGPRPENETQTPLSPRRNGRPICLGGGPPGYADKAVAAVAEPFKGITADGTVTPGLFPLEKTGAATKPIRRAAEEFLGSLNREQRAKTLFPIDTVEWRKWSNIHRTIMRHGMPFFEMSDSQLERALALVKESLSARGLATARDVMRLNETVMEMTGKLDEYGEDLYWLSIMGMPSNTEPWGWQIDGHHLIINYFVLGGQVVMTPTFLGSEPVHAKSGKYAGTRVFQAEEEQGLAMLRALSAAQRDTAILSRDLPREVFTTAFRDNFEMRYEGIRADGLSPEQHELFLCLIEIHVGRMRQGHARIKMDEVRKHFEQTYFAWMGGTNADGVFYYRIHSPVLLVEFDHQKGVAFPAYDKPYKDHIHIIVRTPNGNDYGKDLLRQHYERAPHHSKRG